MTNLQPPFKPGKPSPKKAYFNHSSAEEAVNCNQVPHPVSFRLLSISDLLPADQYSFHIRPRLTNMVKPIKGAATCSQAKPLLLSFLILLWFNKKSRDCLQVSSAPVSSYRSPKSIKKVWSMLSSSKQRSEHIAQAAKWVPRWSMDNNRARTLAKGQHCWWRQLDLWPRAMDLIIFALWDHWQLTSQ